MRFFLSLLFVLAALASCRTRSAVSSPRSVEAVSARPALSAEAARRYSELFLEAVRWKEIDRYDAAHELFAEALRVDSGAPEALYEMALLKMESASAVDSAARAEGLRLLRKAVAGAPANDYYKETLANYLAGMGGYAEAIALCEDIVDRKPTSELLAMLVQLYEANGDDPGAIRALNRLQRIEGHSAELSMEKYQIYVRMGDEENAFRAIEELCAAYPFDLRYRVLLGDLYDREGHHERALDVYRDVLAAEPDNSFAQLSLLAYYKKAGADSLYLALLRDVALNPSTHSEARVEALKSYALGNTGNGADTAAVLRLFARVLELPQENRDVAQLCAQYMYAVKLPEDSLRPVVEKMLEVEPDYRDARLHLLQFALRDKDFARAVVLCRDGEVHAPSDLTFVYYHAVALSQLDRAAEAVEVLRQGAARTADQAGTPGDDPEMRSDLHALLGDLLHEAGQKAEAYESYDHALRHNPTNYLCLNNYAYFLSLDRTRLDEAETMSKRTVDANPDNPTYLDTYAWILYQKRQFTQARIYIDQTLRHATEAPGDASLYDHAGDIYLKLGERAQAARFWRTALKLSDDPALTRVLKKKLRIK